MKMKLCVFTLYDEKGGSSQYRVFIFKESLSRAFEMKWFYFWNNKYATIYANQKKKYIFQITIQYIKAIILRIIQLLFVAPKSDVVFIQKDVIPKIPLLFLKRLRKKGIRIIYDIDDALYTSAKDNSSDIAKNSNVVVCGNDTLREYYSQYCQKCVVLPTVENTNRYISFWNDTFEKKIIGWIGSAASIHSIEMLIKPLNELISAHPEVEFHIICNDDKGFCKKIKNSKLIIWDKDKYIASIAHFTIGVMPLEDTDFNRGKCGFKMIQYLNMKKPVIGSGVGVNSEIIRGNGIEANSSEEWVDAFEKLLYNREMYDSCIRHIETDFFEKYHFENVSSALINILEGNVNE